MLVDQLAHLRIKARSIELQGMLVNSSRIKARRIIFKILDCGDDVLDRLFLEIL